MGETSELYLSHVTPKDRKRSRIAQALYATIKGKKLHKNLSVLGLQSLTLLLRVSNSVSFAKELLLWGSDSVHFAFFTKCIACILIQCYVSVHGTNNLLQVISHAHRISVGQTICCMHNFWHFNMESLLLFLLFNYFNHNLKQCIFFSVNIHIRFTNLSHVFKKNVAPENLPKRYLERKWQETSTEGFPFLLSKNIFANHTYYC